MPERIAWAFPHPLAWLSGAFASASSVLAVLSQENLVAIAMSIVAVGTVLGKPALDFFKKLRETRREEDAADYQAELEKKSKDYQTWNPILVEEQTRRIRAELRIEFADQMAVLKSRNEALEGQVATLSEELQAVRKKAGAAIKQVAGDLEQTKADVQTTKDRVAVVEAVQGSTSGDAYPIPPPQGPPK